MTEWTKITLRLPELIHAALSEVAREGGQSLNQIIVDRLNRSLGGVYVTEAEANDGSILKRIDALEQAIRRLDPAFGQIDDDEEFSVSDALIARARNLRKE